MTGRVTERDGQHAAYGIAIQKAWPKRLRAEWKPIAEGVSLPLSLEKCSIVCAAPTAYWNKWIGDAPTARTVAGEAWLELLLLQKALADYGLPSIFVRLDHLEPIPIDAEICRLAQAEKKSFG